MNSSVRGRSEETLYESLSYQELHQRSSKGWKEQVGIVMMTLLTMMLVLIICNNIFSVQMLLSRFDMTLEMYLELGAGLRLKRGYIVISPLFPPPRVIMSSLVIFWPTLAPPQVMTLFVNSP